MMSPPVASPRNTSVALSSLRGPLGPRRRKTARSPFSIGCRISRHRMRGDHVAIHVELFGGETKREPDKLRQMQHRHVQAFPEIVLDLVLKAVEHGVAERTGREHGLR